MKKRKMFLIINPAARVGEIKEDFPRIKKTLDGLKIPWNYEFTKKPGHATEITKKVIRHKLGNLIIAVGGDGTVNEIGSALLGTKACLGIIPLGTGNDLARNLNIPQDIEQAIALLSSPGRGKKIDAIQIGKHHAFNAIGIGFDAATAEWVQNSKEAKWIQGLSRACLGLSQVCVKKLRIPFRWERTAHVASVLINIFFYEDQKIKITTPEWQFNGRVMMATLANSQSEGCCFSIAPKASIDDGAIDVCVVSQIPRLERILYIIKGMDGSHLSLPGVAYCKIQTLKIESTTPFLAHIDGTPIRLPHNVEVKILPRALRVITGPYPKKHVQIPASNMGLVSNILNLFPAKYRRNIG